VDWYWDRLHDMESLAVQAGWNLACRGILPFVQSKQGNNFVEARFGLRSSCKLNMDSVTF